MYVALRRKNSLNAPIHYCEIVNWHKRGWQIGSHLCNGQLDNLMNAKVFQYSRYEILYEMAKKEFYIVILDQLREKFLFTKTK